MPLGSTVELTGPLTGMVDPSADSAANTYYAERAKLLS